MNSLLFSVLILAIVIFYQILLNNINGCNNNNPFLWNWCNLILISLVVITVSFLKKFNQNFFGNFCGNFFLKKFNEGFAATSPGTMVQLQTSHVPTEEDMYYYRHVYPKLVRREIYNMTESDL